jgi:ABC-type amino acid transport substrate-binding protein
VPQTFSPGRYGVAVRQEDADLLAEINRGLKEIEISTAVEGDYESLISFWISIPELIGYLWLN